jgi:hypothetical protein
MHGVGSLHFARGNRAGRTRAVPPACRGNLQEGVLQCPRFGEVWFSNWYYSMGSHSAVQP